MSTFYGDDVMFGGKILNFLKKSPIVSAAKFVIHPIKESKAAIKTVARFDPTSKTSKYGKQTKGALIGAALAGAAILTGGGALAVGAGIASAAATGWQVGKKNKPVRTPPKTITQPLQQNAPGSPPPLPINSFTDTAAAPPPMANIADNAIASQYATTAKPAKNNLMIIGLLGAAALAAVFLSTKKGSITPSTVSI